MKLLISLLLAIACSVLATSFNSSAEFGSITGIDVSSLTSASTASCQASSGVSVIIPRGYQSVGQVDSNVCNTIANAANNGIKYRETYMFPCPTCSKSASTQMGELVSFLSSNCKSTWSGRIWLDIEGSQYWYSSTTTNRQWYQDLVDSCKTHGVSCGVYSSYYNWESIFGSVDYAYGSYLPLWYAHYDNNPSFSDFEPFGNWNSPYAKQYKGDTTLCGQGVDMNYAPRWS